MPRAYNVAFNVHHHHTFTQDYPIVLIKTATELQNSLNSVHRSTRIIITNLCVLGHGSSTHTKKPGNLALHSDNMKTLVGKTEFVHPRCIYFTHPPGHSLRTVLMTCSGGVVMGLCGQMLYDRFELWRKRKAIELHYPELVQKRVRVKWDMVR